MRRESGGGQKRVEFVTCRLALVCRARHTPAYIQTLAHHGIIGSFNATLGRSIYTHCGHLGSVSAGQRGGEAGRKVERGRVCAYARVLRPAVA